VTPPSPWDADRTLTPRQVLATVRSQFPELNAESAAPLGSGWENDAFLVNDRLVFRFPRRAEIAKRVDWEIGIAGVVGPALAGLEIAVPDFRWRGEPGPHFPYRFAGYPYLPGDAANHPGDELAACRLAESIGAMLERIHGITSRQLGGLDVGADSESSAEIRAEASRAVPDLLRTEPGDIRACAAWLRRGPALPHPFGGELRFLYNDLCPEHVLVAPDRTRVTGLIDFTDASWGDPMLDFVMLPGWLGWTATDVALRRAGYGDDEALRERLRFRTRAKHLYWLHHAHLRGDDVERHRSWVRRAFAPAPGE
jgi:aminoglycoside phosphotransferase (APT) family kinase protein